MESDGGMMGGWAMRLHGKWLVAVGVVAAVGIGGTVGVVDAAGASSGPSSSTTAKSSSEVSSAQFKFTASVTGLAASAVTVTGTGQADFATDSAAVSVNLPAVVAKRLSGGSSSPEVINAVFAKDTVYLEVPGLAAKVGAPWISVSLPAKASADVPTAFDKVAGALGDVDSILALAKQHHATVTSLGTSTVDGVQASGNKIVVSASKKGHARSVTATVWSDSSDRLVQGSEVASGATAKRTIGANATVDVSGYGSPVTITVPPSTQVKSIPWSVVQGLLGKFHFGKHKGTGKGMHKGMHSGWNRQLPAA